MYRVRGSPLTRVDTNSFVTGDAGGVSRPFYYRGIYVYIDTYIDLDLYLSIFISIYVCTYMYRLTHIQG